MVINKEFSQLCWFMFLDEHLKRRFQSLINLRDIDTVRNELRNFLKNINLEDKDYVVSYLYLIIQLSLNGSRANSGFPFKLKTKEDVIFWFYYLNPHMIDTTSFLQNELLSHLVFLKENEHLPFKKDIAFDSIVNPIILEVNVNV